MALLDHVVTCNTHDLAGRRPFRIAGVQVGWVPDSIAERMDRWPQYFAISKDVVTFRDGLKDVEARSKALAEAGAAMVVQQALPRNRKELCPVMEHFGAPNLLRIDRAWLQAFGVTSYGVHINGYVDTADGPDLWVAIRAQNREVAPGKLDNMVAGGLPVGLSLMENVIKESAEEASVPEELARQAKPAGVITYMMSNDAGLRRDMLFVYDLKLPNDFTPGNADGEISGFVRWPARQALRVVDETDEFKFNVNLALIDFGIRHGLIAPDRPDYASLVHGLRAWS